MTRYLFDLGHTQDNSWQGTDTNSGLTVRALTRMELAVMGHYQDISIAGILSMGGSAKLGGNLLPKDTSQQDLGDAAHRFKTLYVDALASGATLPAHTHAETDVTGLTTDLAAKVDTSRTINATAPLSGGGDLSADRTIALANQNANLVLAGPATAPAAAPSFRSLVANDIPNLDAAKITTGALVLARGGTNADLSASGSATAVLAQDASHVISARSLVSGDIPNNAADTTGKSAKTDALNSATTVVNVSSATAPTAGQILRATSSTAATWQSRTIALTFVIDNAGVAITTGTKGYLSIPFACTLTGWILLADQSGSIVVDVKRATYANFPTTSSIAGTDKPTLSSVQKNENLGPLANWGSTAISAGDVLEFNVSSATTVTRVSVVLNATTP